MARISDILPELENLIPASMSKWNIPGLSFALIHADEPVYTQGWGVTDLDHPTPVDASTIFAIGSNSKAFTVTALGLLVAEGKISWDDPVGKYLPDFSLLDPIASSQMTIRDLLCHRGGLGTWSGDLLSYGSSYTREEIIHRLRNIPPAYPFRAGYGYCNLHFMTAGQIIPAVTGISWDEFVTERIFKPLGMDRSFTGQAPMADTPNRALPHERLADRIRPVQARDIHNIGPAGDIYSTAVDMAAWIQMQLNNGLSDRSQIIPAEILAETRQPHTIIRLDQAMRALVPGRNFSLYGMGWFLMDYLGREVIFHTGGVDGMISLAGFIPAEKLGVVILTNKIPHSLINALFYHVMDSFFGAPQTDWDEVFWQRDLELEQKEQEKKQAAIQQMSHAPASKPLAEYAGDYESNVYGPATIRLEEGQLLLSLSAHPAIYGQLEPWDADTFECKWTDPVFDRSLIPFKLSESGQPVEFRLQVRPDWIDTLEYVFRRK
jgi:CubicO group peptidase (beta-lactamase class C family)